MAYCDRCAALEADKATLVREFAAAIREREATIEALQEERDDWRKVADERSAEINRLISVLADR